MKILVISELAPSADQGDITGGVESIMHFLFPELRKEHEVVVISQPGKMKWSEASFRSIPSRIKFLAKAIMSGLQNNFDVVVGMTFVTYPAAWLVGTIRRKPVVFWYHDVLIGRWRQHFGGIVGMVGECIERLMINLPGVSFIANSQTTANRLRLVGVNNPHVVFCGVTKDVILREDRKEPARLRLLSIGRLVPYKRIDWVIRSMFDLRVQFPDLELLVIGQGPELENLRSLSIRYGLGERVRFAGLLESHEEVIKELRHSSVLVSPSLVEGFGIVVVEAMSQGVPLVLSNIPAFREVVGETSSAKFFDSSSQESLTQTLKDVLTDQNLRYEMSRNGIQRAHLFTWESAANESNRVFRMVLGEKT